MSPRRPAPRRRGSVLVIVLVTVLFASFALALFVERAGVDLLVDLRESTARRLRQEAYSALEVTLAVLEEFRQYDNGLRSPAEGWDDPLGFAGWTPAEGCTAEVTFEDESGKMSLSHVEPATLIELFKSWELPQSEAEKLTDGLLTWMRKDYVPTGAFSPDYDRTALPYVAPARALRSFTELAAIDRVREVFYDKDGRPNDYWHRFAATFSLFDFRDANLNSAPPDVLAALGAYDDQQRNRLADYRAGRGVYQTNGPGIFKTTADAAGFLGTKAIPNGFGTEIRALRINIAIRQGRSTYRLSAVVAPPGGARTVEAMKSVAPADSASASGAAAGSTGTPGSTAPATSAEPGKSAAGSDAAAAKKLNYPFTLLEITENVENSPPPAPPPSDA